MSSPAAARADISIPGSRSRARSCARLPRCSRSSSARGAGSSATCCRQRSSSICCSTCIRSTGSSRGRTGARCAGCGSAWRALGDASIAQHPSATVIGTGGYASGAALAFAFAHGIPIELQEQNSVPGITTRFFARRARAVYLGYPEAKARLHPRCATRSCSTAAIRSSRRRRRDRRARRRAPRGDFRRARAPWCSPSAAARARVRSTMRSRRCWTSVCRRACVMIWATGQGSYDRYARYESRPRARAPVSRRRFRVRTPPPISRSRAPARSRWPSSARGEFRRCSCRCPRPPRTISARTRARSRLPVRRSTARAEFGAQRRVARRCARRSARLRRRRLAAMAEAASLRGSARCGGAHCQLGTYGSHSSSRLALEPSRPRALYCGAPHDTFRCPRSPSRPLRRHRRRRDERARRASRSARDHASPAAMPTPARTQASRAARHRRRITATIPRTSPARRRSSPPPRCRAITPSSPGRASSASR